MNPEFSENRATGLSEEEYFFFRLLSEVEGIGAIKIKNLHNSFSNFHSVFSASTDELMHVEGISHELARRIRQSPKSDAALSKKIAEEAHTLNSLNGRCLMFWEAEYPTPLKRIYDPPVALYILGELLPADELALGIVGTRQPTAYGRQAAGHFAKDLASAGWTIISGLARGIDTIAHESALKEGTRTIAVLGSGLDNIYPPENRNLAEAIIRNGAIISEYPIGVQPDAINFPKRNRIISGLSKGVLIVETKLTGGALITAKYATDQNREVYAVPGSIFSSFSEGTNMLIERSQAKLVRSAEDILEDFSPQPGVKQKPKPREEFVHTLNLFEQKLVSCLSDQPITIDKLSQMTSFSISDCLVHLLSLEFKGIVRQLPGKMFILE